MSDAFDALAAKALGGAQQQFVARLTDKLVEMLVEGVDEPDRYAALVATAPSECMGVWAQFAGKVTDDVRDAFMEALAQEDDAICAPLVAAYGRIGDTSTATNAMNEAARGMGEIFRRQNVALAGTAADAYFDAVSDAVESVNRGEGRDEILERTVPKLAASMVETVDYKSGVHTAIDAAMRRHIVTQFNQARNDLLMNRCDEYGCDLVMVSAHFGARPTHAVWQGQAYSRSGKTPGYRNLYDATGYGTVAGLCGANCRHTMTPYVPGYSKLPDTEFASQTERTGMTSDEYYAAAQKQRAMERRIRQTKRELNALRKADPDSDIETLRVTLGRQQGKLASFVKQNHLTRDYSREKAYGVEKQPVALRNERTARSQSNSNPQKAIRVPKVGSFKGKLIDLGRKADLKAVNRNFKSGEDEWTENCQRCVVAYEMRRRGLNVRALPSTGVIDPVADNWREYFSGTSFERCPTGNGRSDVIDKMLKWGDGSRAIVYVCWRNGGAHGFCAENIGGNVVFVDPQSGQYGCDSFFYKAGHGYTEIERVDGFPLSEKAKGCFENEGL